MFDEFWRFDYDGGMGEPPNMLKLVDLVVVGKPTDQDVKDEAFRLWVELGRSFAAVSRRTGINDATLGNWARTENWEQRRADSAAAFLPGKKVETAINLRLAAHSASVRLVEIGLDAVERGIKPDPKEVDSCVKMAAAGGYSSFGSRNPLDSLDSSLKGAEEVPDFNAMSHEEITAYQDSILRRSKRFAPANQVVNGSRPT